MQINANGYFSTALVNAPVTHPAKQAVASLDTSSLQKSELPPSSPKFSGLCHPFSGKWISKAIKASLMIVALSFPLAANASKTTTEQVKNKVELNQQQQQDIERKTLKEQAKKLIREIRAGQSKPEELYRAATSLIDRTREFITKYEISPPENLKLGQQFDGLENVDGLDGLGQYIYELEHRANQEIHDKKNQKRRGLAILTVCILMVWALLRMDD